MAQSSPENRFNTTNSEGEITPGQPHLGIKKPILPPSTLGQSFLSPKFLSPLGAKPLGESTSLAGFVQALPSASLPDNFFQDSPFFTESRLSFSNPEVAVTEANDVVNGLENPNPSTSLPPLEDKRNLTPQPPSLQGKEEPDLSIQSTDANLLRKQQLDLSTQPIDSSLRKKQQHDLSIQPIDSHLQKKQQQDLSTQSTDANLQKKQQQNLLTQPIDSHLQRKQQPDLLTQSTDANLSRKQQPDLSIQSTDANLQSAMTEEAAFYAGEELQEKLNLGGSEAVLGNETTLPMREEETAQSFLFPQEAREEVNSVFNLPTGAAARSAPGMESDQMIKSAQNSDRTLIQLDMSENEQENSITPSVPENASVAAPIELKDFESEEIVAETEYTGEPKAVASFEPTQNNEQQAEENDNAPSYPQANQLSSSPSVESSFQESTVVAPAPQPTQPLVQAKAEIAQPSELNHPSTEPPNAIAPSLETDNFNQQSNPYESSAVQRSITHEHNLSVKASKEQADLTPQPSFLQEKRELDSSQSSLQQKTDTTKDASQQKETLSTTEDAIHKSETVSSTSSLSPAPSLSSTNLLQRHVIDDTPESTATPEALSKSVKATAPLSESSVDKTTISKPTITTPIVQSKSLPHSQQKSAEITKLNETSIAPKLDTNLPISDNQQVESDSLSASLDSVTQAIVPAAEIIVQPLLEKESFVQKQIVSPELVQVPTQTTSETSVTSVNETETLPQQISPIEIEATEEGVTDLQIPTQTTSETSIVQHHPAETLPQQLSPPEIEITEEGVINPQITTPITSETSVVQHHPAETLPQQLSPIEIEATEEGVTDSQIPTQITSETSIVQRHPETKLQEISSVTPVNETETLPQQLSPIEIEATEEGVTNPQITTPITSETSIVQLHPETATMETSVALPGRVKDASPAIPANLLQQNVTEDESFEQNREIPLLPTVLENLVEISNAVPLIQPLNQQSQFIGTVSTAESSKEQPTIVQKTSEILPSHSYDKTFSKTTNPIIQVPPLNLDTEPLTMRRFATDEISEIESFANTSNVPDSWSNIAELLGEYPTNFSSSQQSIETPIQRALDDDSNGFIPIKGNESNPWESLISENPRYSNLSSVPNPETSLQKFSPRQEASPEEALPAEYSAQQENSDTDDSQSLEMLAWEIYSLIKQRLEIERERYGNYYSGRLPW